MGTHNFFQIVKLRACQRSRTKEAAAASVVALPQLGATPVLSRVPTDAETEIWHTFFLIRSTSSNELEVDAWKTTRREGIVFREGKERIE